MRKGTSLGKAMAHEFHSGSSETAFENILREFREGNLVGMFINWYVYVSNKPSC